MLLSVFKQSGLGALRYTTVRLQLADRSYVYPEGVIEDVLLQIGKLIFPADFIILDYVTNELVPIILGQPLLAIGDAIIKVREGKMILRVDNEEAVFNIAEVHQVWCDCTCGVLTTGASSQKQPTKKWAEVAGARCGAGLAWGRAQVRGSNCIYEPEGVSKAPQIRS
uniref:Uncharacterized protein n=1 Tax=Nicotiana tabacum TaxID=4097 RepID=A0A1S3Y280_TOBAC|nr:PREDICTED: uncharacterized protein LOC107771386 [Nicotiana tabacum]